ASVHSQLARLHITEGQEINPLSPPSFCQVLRKHLIPGRVLGFDQPPWERSVTMRVESFGSTEERVERHLIFEIMGRHSNVILVDGQSGKIIDAMKRIPASQNSYREILPHREYVPPPQQSKESPTEITFETFDRLLRHLPADSRI